MNEHFVLMKLSEVYKKYLNWDTLRNVQNELYVSVVVVVGSSRDRYIMICHFYVLCGRREEYRYSE